MKNETGKIELPGKFFVSSETLLISIILLFTFLIYAGSLSNDFLTGWDDGEYLSDQSVSGNGPINTTAIFSNFHLGMYQPLPVLTFAINYKMAGDTAWPYIFTNLLLHLLNTLLVFRLMKRWMQGFIPAGIVALLFAIHPMHVEAVSWISTRSSGLYSFFFLAALLYWDRYLESEKKAKYYLYALLFALLAMFSKSMAATFPLILLLIDFLKGRKLSLKLIAEKIPFFAFSVIFGIIAIKAADSFGHITVLEQDYTIIQRFILILYGIAFYIIKLLAPTHLSAIYAFPELVNGSLPAYVYSSLLVLLLATCGLWFSGKNRKEFIAGSLFFLLSISMVLPLFWSRIFITADRYTYIPYIGLFMIVARLFSNLYEARSTIDRTNSRMLIIASVLILALLSAATFNRTKTWKDTPTLLTDVIEKKRSDADMAHGYFYLANYYDAANNNEEAMKYYDLSLSRNPRYLLALNNRGILKGKAGYPAGAIDDFNAAIRIKPDYAEAFYNRGVALYQTGNPDKACEDWNKALKLKFRPAGDAITNYCQRNVLPDFNQANQQTPKTD
ncbi:MAG: tetratricopeptide repeat protein [Lentimicrobium sp.]|nr:tetratricopeptide repeat protein [Lentimicrobium sp.]